MLQTQCPRFLRKGYYSIIYMVWLRSITTRDNSVQFPILYYDHPIFLHFMWRFVLNLPQNNIDPHSNRYRNVFFNKLVHIILKQCTQSIINKYQGYPSVICTIIFHTTLATDLKRANFPGIVFFFTVLATHLKLRIRSSELFLFIPFT